jgi:antitoxin (DNA-binding transcriptional repressor) of toxin-antitoxin stability system
VFAEEPQYPSLLSQTVCGRFVSAVRNVSITDLRENLSAYLARVSRGERLRVASRGKVIAEICPPSANNPEIVAARKRLRGSVLRYDRPLDPVIDSSEWEVNR